MEQVKKGFKKTEVGVIPEEWSIYTLREVANYRRGSFPQPYGLSKWYDDLMGAPFVQVYDVDTNNKLKASTKQNISKEAQALSVFVPKGTVVLTLQGSIGRIALTQYDAYVDRTLLIFESYRLVVDKYYFLLVVKELFNKEKQSAPGGTIKTITKEALSVFNIPIPPTLTEQKAIATALSDVDELITKLEKLIEKKKAIKQGAVQELFKPKSHWKTQPIRELAKYRRGSFPQPYGLPKWYDEISGIPFVQVVDVDDNKRLKKETKARISKEGEKFSVFVPKGTIILTIQGSIGRICITEYDSYVDRTLLIFESFLADFDKYFFMMSVFLKFEIEKEKAPGGIIKTITKQALSSFEISYPSLEEQQAISKIIQSMDGEIELLAKKLSKLSIVKQGMMQELLTGKTRLI